MGELQTSLHGSRKALLALDLGGIERETSNQAVLIQEFDALLRRGALAPPAAEESAFDWSACTPELEEKLRRSVSRILDAVRLQAALLARAQGKLRVLANMLAGPSVLYGPLLARNGSTDIFGWKRSGEM
jgi:hypothetical protein